MIAVHNHTMAHRYRITSERYPEYAASAHEVIRMLGLPTTKLPEAGLVDRMIQGIRVWVRPLTRIPGRRRNFALRVMAECPGCGRAVTVSRLPQHRCKPATPQI